MTFLNHHHLSLLLKLSIILVISSCNGQNRPHVNHAPTEISSTQDSKMLGRIVSELDPAIWNIFQDKDQNYWFGSKGNGVYLFNGAEITHYSIKDGLINNQVRGIQEDSLGNIYIETDHGISQYDGHSFQTLEVAKNDGSGSYLSGNLKDDWFRIGFQNEGPFRYDGEFLHFEKFPPSPTEVQLSAKILNYNFTPYGIYKIYRDRSGALWFGTSGIGICRYDGLSLRWHYEEQLQTTPSGGDFGSRAIFQDEDGYYWINNTRYRYELLPDQQGDTLSFKKHNGIGIEEEDGSMHFPFFLDIEQDSDGNLWMVTYDDGVWKYDGDELTNYPIKDNGKDVLLFTIYKDQEGTLWLGSHNAGVLKFNGESYEKFQVN